MIQCSTFQAAVNYSSSTVSCIEQSETVEDELLEKIAIALGVSTEPIKSYNEDSVIYNIQNNYDNAANNINYNFNPIDKIVQLYDEKIALLERLLLAEKEKNELLKNSK